MGVQSHNARASQCRMYVCAMAGYTARRTTQFRSPHSSHSAPAMCLPGTMQTSHQLGVLAPAAAAKQAAGAGVLLAAATDDGGAAAAATNARGPATDAGLAAADALRAERRPLHPDLRGSVLRGSALALAAAADAGRAARRAGCRLAAAGARARFRLPPAAAAAACIELLRCHESRIHCLAAWSVHTYASGPEFAMCPLLAHSAAHQTGCEG